MVIAERLEILKETLREAQTELPMHTWTEFLEWLEETFGIGDDDKARDRLCSCCDYVDPEELCNSCTERCLKAQFCEKRS